MHRVRVGIVILTEDRWWSGEPKWRQAEELGFDHAWTYDHLAWRNLADGPWLSAIPTLTAAATVTSRIALGTLVTAPSYRHPVPFMRDLITLDDISDGRLIAGLGSGMASGGLRDRATIGEPERGKAELAAQFEEFVEVLDGLLTTDKFDHRGRFYTVNGARNLPGSVQRPRVPFAIAANGPRSQAVAARFGQGWITTGKGGDDQESWWRGVAQLSEQFTWALDAHDRDPGSVARYLMLDSGPTYALSSVETFTEAANRARKLGFTDVIVHWPRANEPYAGSEAVLERVADEALAEVKRL